jgi:hypothetical protein
MNKLLFIFAGLLLTVSVFSQTYWSLTGNSGTTPGTNFIGTTDNQPLIFKMDNVQSGFVGVVNIAFGYNSYLNAAASTTSANHSNSAFGTAALASNSTGLYNTGIGCYALQVNTTGISNTGVGYYALNVETGSNNTAIGHRALSNQNSHTGNTAIGFIANINGNTSNSTVLGNYAAGTASNQVTIGNSSVTSIRGYANWTNISDGRVKKNIRSNVPGLEFITKLQPVTYTMDLDAADKIIKASIPQHDESDLDPATVLINKKSREAKEKIVYTGFIAQDVEKTAQSIGFDFSGVDVPPNDNTLYGLRYSEFVVPLVKSVQELSEQNASLQSQVDKLTELVNLLLDKEERTPFPNTKNSSAPDASLEQSYPNPFTSSATIAYSLPQSFCSAKIVITAMSGQELRQFPLSRVGTGSITITELPAGTYYYSLYVNDTLVDTKKMIKI